MEYNKIDTSDKIIKVGFSWRPCGKDFHGKAFREYKNGDWIWTWNCPECYRKYGHTSQNNRMKIKPKYLKELEDYDATNRDATNRLEKLKELCNKTNIRNWRVNMIDYNSKLLITNQNPVNNDNLNDQTKITNNHLLLSIGVK